MEIGYKIKNTYISTATADFWKIKFQQNDTKIHCNIPVSEKNWAFLDMQNLHKGVQEKGWRINWKLFRQYLEKEYDVTKAVIFMGYLQKNAGLYHRLKNAGCDLEFRKINHLRDGKIDGGNVDADLASYVMDYKNDYTKAIIVADDGDYCRTLESLNRQNKLKLIISSHSIRKTSHLIKGIVSELILSIDSLKPIIEYKEKNC